MAGQQPQTQTHQAPGGQASPGYGWAKGFFNSLPGVTQNPYPGYQGQLDPGLSPTMQNAIRMSQGYSQAGPPEILQGAQGSLGRFMTPSFMDPRMRLPMGSPNLFGANPNQKMFGGGPLGQLGQGFSGMQNTTGGGLMNQQMPQFGGNQMGGGRMPNPFGMQSMTGPGLQSGGGVGQRMPWSGAPPQDFQWGGGGGGMQSVNGGGLQSGGPSMSYATGGGLQGGPSAPGQYQGQVGAQTAWDMGNQANRGQVQNGQIFLGGGQGGESGQWQTYDPNNWGHKQTADLFNRYGSNWASGSGATGAHGSEMQGYLQNWLGRDPTEQEKSDLYFGANPDAAKIKAAFAAQSAAYDPSSASYDPNAKYSSAAYRGPAKVSPTLPGGGGASGVGQVRGGQPNLAALLSGLNPQKRKVG
jgi:hypothetical protein